MKSTRTLDIATGLIFVAIAIAIIWVAIPLGVQEPKKVKFVALSPSYYPRLVCYCLLALGLLLSVSRLLQRSSSSDTAVTAGSAKSYGKALPMLLAIATTLFLYYWFLLSLGFVVCSSLALFTFMLLAGEKKLWALIVIPLAVPMLLYLFFTEVANIPIPAGILQTLLVGA